MDLSSMLGKMLSEDSVNNIGKAAGVSPEKVQSVLGNALPSLLGGALAQSESGDSAEGFAGALNQHAAGDVSNLGAFLGQVDMADGAKIVNHLLGKDSGTVDEIAKASGVSKKDTANVMAAAAPLLMSLLGQQTGSQQQAQSTAAVSGILGALIKNVDMGSLIMGLLGSGSAAPAVTVEEPKEEEKKPDGLLGILGSLLK